MTDDELRDMLSHTSTDRLTDQFVAYCQANALPYISADELLLDVMAQIERLQRNRQWLNVFIAQWDIVQDAEDAEFVATMWGGADDA